MITALLTFIALIILSMFKRSIYYEWVYMSFTYLKRKKQATKMFDGMSETMRRDFYLESIFIEDESKWYYRAMEKYIRNKYIEPIVKGYGAIRTN